MLRQARLKRDSADRFPALEPEQWHTAAALVGQIKGILIAREGPSTQLPQRILDDENFEFRGGSRFRRDAGHTRHQDRKMPRYLASLSALLTHPA